MLLHFWLWSIQLCGYIVAFGYDSYRENCLMWALDVKLKFWDFLGIKIQQATVAL